MRASYLVSLKAFGARNHASEPVWSRSRALTLWRTRDARLDTVTQAEVLRSFHGVREDLARFDAAGGMVRAVRAFAGGGEPDRRVFNLLYHGLDSLEARDSGFTAFEAAFGLKLSILAGYAPQLDACLNCQEIPRRALVLAYFAPALGSVLCADCRTISGDSFPLVARSPGPSGGCSPKVLSET